MFESTPDDVANGSEEKTCSAWCVRRGMASAIVAAAREQIRKEAEGDMSPATYTAPDGTQTNRLTEIIAKHAEVSMLRFRPIPGA